MLLFILGIYTIGFIWMALSIKYIKGLNKLLHSKLNVRSPAVFATIIWPATCISMFICYIVNGFFASVNWLTGNGFVVQTQEVKRMGIH